MTLDKPFNKPGTDTENPYAKTYKGKVVDNNDPKRLKRIKVMILPWEDLVDEDLPWVVPEGRNNGCSPNYDEHDIPEEGADISVYFNNDDPNDPRYTGCEVTEENRCSLFDEDYPNTTGKKDSAGNFSITNKKTGVTVYHHNSGTQVQLDPDGSFTITGKSGCVATCDASGNFQIKGISMNIACDDEITLQATRISLNADNGVDINGDIVNITGNTKLSEKSPLIELSGSSLDLRSNITTVYSLFEMLKGASYTLLDPIAKSCVEFRNGVCISNKKMG